uniref:Uncharacterized protein n=2 Tax=viral metagenome TaxID=1070528 RepID=A0A6M3XEL1_9ZZZZ
MTSNVASKMQPGLIAAAIIFCLGVLAIVITPGIALNPAAANTSNMADFTSPDTGSVLYNINLDNPDHEAGVNPLFSVVDLVTGSGPPSVYRGRQVSTDTPAGVMTGVSIDVLVAFALLDLHAQTDSTRLDSILSLYHVTYTYPGGCFGKGCN